MENIKGFLSKFSDKAKKIIIAAVVGVAVVAGAVIMALSMREKPYEVMFTSVGNEEAKQIIGKLQEEKVDYQYLNGDILVPAAQMDVTKARLVSEGYPKSGFTYDVFKNNVNLMTTDSDRQTFKLYDLETRIGSTIQLFDGVKEAYVTIALGETSKYALSEDDAQEASAQAVVVMKDGGSPTEEQAKSIQLLISRSIPGMVISNVSVFDGNGKEVSTDSGEEDINSGKTAEEISKLIEDQIAAKVMNVLGPVYGNGNVRVSVKGTVNMDKLIRESTVYNVPEKIDENDKTGLTSEESIYREYSGNGQTASGVAGSEANADIPQYNAGGAAGDNSAYGSSSLNRKYLLNQIKEQGQINPGSLENLTVSVVVNGNGFGTMTIDDIRNLAGNAAGIAQADRAEKITAVAAPFYTIDVPKQPDEPVETGANGILVNQWILIAALAGVFLLLLIIILVVRHRRKKKALMENMEDLEDSQEDVPIIPEFTKEPDEEREILVPEEDRGAELRESVREFAEQNPEISAQLLKTWLNGGNNNDN
ncbi:flagellar basal-body MS-ring/collar protein FliF [Lacrimispora saccharolytica]|uniref:Flagellar M-ring protein FliF n=1 Tax=Lacrimispora saccharolytica (strain ATCC 35040 / DSM 2544 / NRCC 2533 / WM1) TaxID=610130 RepID=D9RA23_LACSW|nr:flagellar basal-body MS-ring/collar protein FliF [Lacrimispora saccharolytica]ADL05995.1 flagellar M-ring protein FliF [[Clostridium] saccharolyticum WM1]QRV19876.1 flagellar M-ring protein FliF [Lacrimispora saccharolytica]